VDRQHISSSLDNAACDSIFLLKACSSSSDSSPVFEQCSITVGLLMRRPAVT
jgi:hypothetical protein